MNRPLQILGTVFSGGVLALAGCSQGSTPVAAMSTDISSSVAKQDKPEPGKEQPKPDAPPLEAGTNFKFPDDNGGKILGKTLLPPVPATSPDSTSQTPRERTLPRFLDPSAPPIPDSNTAPPTFPALKPKETRPSALPERLPRELGEPTPQLPERSELPTGPLYRAEGRDVNLPAELPLLSMRPVADRAPLSDPSREFTALSVITANLPLREATTAFVRLNLPEPFENANDAKPRTTTTDDPNRSLATPPPPRVVEAK